MPHTPQQVRFTMSHSPGPVHEAKLDPPPAPLPDVEAVTAEPVTVLLPVAPAPPLLPSFTVTSLTHAAANKLAVMPMSATAASPPMMMRNVFTKDRTLPQSGMSGTEPSRHLKYNG